MLKSEINQTGEHVNEEYPQVKQWQHYSTYALFSSENDAVIICADKNHSNDFVGMKVIDTDADEWIKVKNFEIVIKG